jgi:type VI secretion system secreted protein Hcp
MPDFFLRMDGVRGEVTARPYVGWIGVNSFAAGGGNSRSFGSSGGAGKVSVNSYRFVKAIDAASSVLSRFCAGGNRIHSAELHALRSGKVIFRMAFDEVLVTSFDQLGLTENFDISFSRMRVTYQTEPPSEHAQSSMGWNLQSGKVN